MNTTDVIGQDKRTKVNLVYKHQPVGKSSSEER